MGCRAAAHSLQQFLRRGEEALEVLERGTTTATELVGQQDHERHGIGAEPPVRVQQQQ